MQMRTTLVCGLAGALAALVLGACVGSNKTLSAEDKERLKAYVLEAPPADLAHRVDINYENKVRIVGWKADPEIARPGTDVKLTYYWRTDDTVEDGWQLFTHIQQEGSDKPENLDGAGPLREKKGERQILAPDRWERGKVYVDEQTYRVPDTAGPEFTVYVGVWKGDARLRVISGPNDGENRGIVMKVKTGVERKPDPPKKTDIPVLKAEKLAKGETITIDGKADEKGWGAAAGTGPFVEVGTGKPNGSFPVNGSVKVLWDDAKLYFFFDVKDPDVVGYYTDAKAQPKDFTVTGQPKLWLRDTVEMMIDPDGDGDNKDYFELQINPQNRVFHSRFDGYNSPRGNDDGPFGHEDWDPKLKSAVVVSGTVDKKDDKDEGYTVEVEIPWAAFAKGAKTLPPKHGDAWRVNFYAMKGEGGVAWSPILGQGNFHRASRFGRIVWAERGRSLDAALDGGAPGDGGVLAGERGAPGDAAAGGDATPPGLLPRGVLEGVQHGRRPVGHAN